MNWYRNSVYARLVVRRAVLGILTLFLVSLVVFFATQLLPGDTARAVLGRSATPERLEALRAQLHLDEPAPVQFGRWAGGLARVGGGVAQRAGGHADRRPSGGCRRRCLGLGIRRIGRLATKIVLVALVACYRVPPSGACDESA